MEAAAETPSAHLGFLDKLRVLLACAVAVLLMRSVGWHVARPADPELAVTLTESGRGALAVWPALVLLTAVAASLGTVIVGRRLPEGGVFAAGIGLAALALRGNSMQMVLGYRGSAEAAGRRSLMISMACDAVLWAAILAVSWVVVVMVRRWLWPEPASEPDTPEASDRKGRKKADEPAEAKPGWYALAVTGVLAAVIIWLTIARTPVAQVARGQVVASVAAGLFLGAMGARYFTGVEEAHWYALAALAVALTGYLLGYLNAGLGWAEGSTYQPFADLATTPPHALVRPLPIEYLAIGVSGALAGFWSGRKIEYAAGEESK